tara:strand:- start:781 stop:1005 length:225 start_codon:yes stop_codon:yes gene_type:complete
MIIEKDINEKIKELEKKIAKIKGILKANSLKLSKNEVNLSASEKSDLWDKLEKLEDELNEELCDAGVELNSWDW